MNYTKGERIYYEAKDTDGNKSYIIMAGLGILGKFKFESDAQLDVAAPFLYEACKDALEKSHNPVVETILMEVLAKAEEK